MRQSWGRQNRGRMRFDKNLRWSRWPRNSQLDSIHQQTRLSQISDVIPKQQYLLTLFRVVWKDEHRRYFWRGFTLVGDKNDFKYLSHYQAGVRFEVLLVCYWQQFHDLSIPWPLIFLAGWTWKNCSVSFWRFLRDRCVLVNFHRYVSPRNTYYKIR